MRSASRVTCSSRCRSPTRCSSARPPARPGPRSSLYLLLTIAPFAVIAPVFGPLLDKTRGGRRLIFAASMATRGVLCLVMAAHVHSVVLYPLAFGALVLSKVQSVTKSALVPAVIKDKSELVLANSRLALISILGGIAAGPLAAGILRVAARAVGAARRGGHLPGRDDRLARPPACWRSSRGRSRVTTASHSTRAASSRRAARWRCCVARWGSSRSSPRSSSRRSTNPRGSTASCC